MTGWRDGHRIAARSLLEDVLEALERVDPLIAGVDEPAASLAEHHDPRAIDGEHPAGRLGEVAQHVLHLEPIGRGPGEVGENRDERSLINHSICFPNGSGGRSGRNRLSRRPAYVGNRSRIALDASTGPRQAAYSCACRCACCRPRRQDLFAVPISALPARTAMGRAAQCPGPEPMLRWLRMPQRPARAGVYGFALAVLLVTGLLMLPAATAEGTSTGFHVALFTATSSVCVTGLTIVDTATHWSTFGHVAILVGVQLGGLGIMTFASLLGLLLSHRLGLRTRLLVAAETQSSQLGEVSRVVIRVVTTSLADRSRHRGGVGGPVHDRLRPHGRSGGLSGRVPLDLRLQQRRLRPAERQPRSIRHGPVGEPDHRRCGHFGQCRLSGAVRALPRAQDPATMVPAHQDHSCHVRSPAGRRHGDHHGLRMDELQDIRTAERPGQTARRLLPRRDAAQRGLQHRRRGGDARADAGWSPTY